MKINKSVKGTLLLLLISIIWGSTFTAQDIAAQHIGPFTFNFARYIVGAAVLLPVALISSGTARRRQPQQNKTSKKTLIIGIIVSGAALFAPAAFQQAGIAYTTSGKAGFITAMYIVFVPLFGLFLKKKAGLPVWVGVLLSCAGLWLLCMKGDLTIGRGELLVLCGAVFWAIQILVIDHFAVKMDCFVLACGECFVCGLLSGVMMLVLETPSFADMMKCVWPILYSGVMSCGVAFGLQPLGQRNAPPATAALVMSLESVFAAISGFVFLNERMELKEYIGCVLMFAAVIVVQLPELRKKPEAVCSGEK